MKLKDSERKLPVYVCRLPEDGKLKYILPMYGAGLWGPIWGYIAMDSDGQTIYGAYFAHQGETPGLGAEIEKPAFSDQFDGKSLFDNGSFMSVAVLKKGLKPARPRRCRCNLGWHHHLDRCVGHACQQSASLPTISEIT